MVDSPEEVRVEYQVLQMSVTYLFRSDLSL